MGIRDIFRSGKKATLPRGAKVVRRNKKRGNGSDLGYWDFNTFYLLDGTMANSYEYEGGENSGEVLSTNEARTELSDHGYNANDYTAPSTSSHNYGSSYDSGSYDRGSYPGGHSDHGWSSGYSGGSSSDYGSGGSYSGGSSGGSDSGSSSGGGD